MNLLNNKQRIIYKTTDGCIYYSRLEAIMNFEQMIKVQTIYYFKEI